MAATFPTICAEFLDKITDPFLYRCGKYPEVTVPAEALHRVGNYALAINHRLAQDLRWTFRWRNAPDRQLEFNVECLPRRPLGIDSSVLAEAAEEQGLEAKARINGIRLIYSVAIGHESKAYKILDTGIVQEKLMDFAVDGMMAMLHLLRDYGERPALRPAKSASKRVAGVADTTVTEQIRLALEEKLEDLILEQWSHLDFGAKLLFIDRQMQCGDVGCLDILASDKATGGLVVIELKRDEGDDEAFGQLCRYMGWVAENKDQPEEVPVAGIIVAAEITPKLKAAAKTNPNVRLVEYGIKLELSPKGSVKTGDGN